MQSPTLNCRHIVLLPTLKQILALSGDNEESEVVCVYVKGYWRKIIPPKSLTLTFKVMCLGKFVAIFQLFGDYMAVAIVL